MFSRGQFFRPADFGGFQIRSLVACLSHPDSSSPSRLQGFEATRGSLGRVGVRGGARSKQASLLARRLYLGAQGC